MKTKRISVICLVILFSSVLIRGQEYKVQVQNSAESKLVLKNLPNDLPVTGYNGNEIIITSSKGDFTPPERSKGLKPVYPGGNDNSGMGLNIEKNGNTVTITCILPITRRADYQVRVPENISLKIQSGCEKASDISVDNVKGEIDIQNCYGIKLTNVAGPLVLSTISGDIEVNAMSTVSTKTMSINSVSGEIDVTIPGKASVSLDISTVAGTLYSNFDFEQPKQDMKRVGGSKISHDLNGGGIDISLASVSGNIYLRKGN